MLLGELISGLDVRLAGGPASGRGDGPASVRVCDITEDSRTALPGSLFIARRGIKDDGRRFVPAALGAGAVAVLTDDPAFALPRPEDGAGGHGGGGGSGAALLLATDVELVTAQIAERFYGNPSSKLTLIGVTGTNGKTTVAYLVHQLLNGLGVRCGLISTVEIDDGVGVAPAVLTTPPSIEVSRTLALMAESGCRAAVMEVSSHALHQRRVAALRFDVGVFTNLTGDHLDYHGTMGAYAAAKAGLFAMLPDDATAIVNADDPWHARMVDGCRARVMRASARGLAGADLSGSITLAGPRWTRAEMRGPWSGGTLDVRLRLIGPHNVMNALQAVGVVHAVGCSLGRARAAGAWTGGTLAAALTHADAPPGRLQLVSGERDGVTVYVDYAHTDDALRNVLTVLRETIEAPRSPLYHPAAAGSTPTEGAEPAPRLWAVFGCGGDRDKSKRPRMGGVAAEIADEVVITSDNPRTERPSEIIGEIIAGVPEAARVRMTVEADRARAIRLAIRRASPGDVVLIAGKGHEDYQVLPDGAGGTLTRHFDDREEARAALALRGSPTGDDDDATAPRPGRARTISSGTGEH